MLQFAFPAPSRNQYTLSAQRWHSTNNTESVALKECNPLGSFRVWSRNNVWVERRAESSRWSDSGNEVSRAMILCKENLTARSFGHDNGLMTLLKTQPKLKFLSFTCCADCRFGVSSGSIDKVLYFSFHSTGGHGGNVLLLFPNLPCGSERLFYGVSR